MGPSQWQGYAAHMLPGRLRVWLPFLRHNRLLAHQLTHRLQSHPGVTGAAANPDTGSLLVHYHPGQISLARLAACLGLTPPPPAPPVRAQTTLTVTQATQQVVLSGAALAAVAVKRALVGPTPHWWSTWELSSVVTMLAGYPFLRRGVQGALTQRRLNGDLAIAAAGLIATLLRENLLGLSILFLSSLCHWLFARTQQAYQHQFHPHRDPLQPDHVRRAAAAQAARWGTYALTAGVATGLLTGDWRRTLATVIAAAPAATIMGATLPHTTAATVAARREPRELPRLTARATHMARQNQRLSAAMNGAGLVMAATGLMPPLTASLWHNLTTLTVVGNSLRLHRV